MPDAPETKHSSGGLSKPPVDNFGKKIYGETEHEEPYGSKKLSKQIDNFIEKKLSSPQDVFRQKDITPRQQQIFQDVNAVREKHGAEWHPKQSPNRIMSSEERKAKYAVARKHGADSGKARVLRDQHYATMGRNLGFLKNSLDEFLQKWGKGVYPPNKKRPWNPFRKKGPRIKWHPPEEEGVRIKNP